MVSENSVEGKTCHDCGLEDIDACVEGIHRPTIPTQYPCLWCLRNPKLPSKYDKDHWNEAWTLDELGEAIIERR